jgi:hypothetical protein
VVSPQTTVAAVANKGMVRVSGKAKRSALLVTTPHFKPARSIWLMSSSTPSKA